MDFSPGIVTKTLFCLCFVFLQQQLDIPIPKYFMKEKLDVVKGREKILAQILADTGVNVYEVVCISF